MGVECRGVVDLQRHLMPTAHSFSTQHPRAYMGERVMSPGVIEKRHNGTVILWLLLETRHDLYVHKKPTYVLHAVHRLYVR